MIIKANYKHINSIVDIHLNSFKDFFMTKLGKKFLKIYYKSILNYEYGVLLVGINNGEIIGFAAGFIYPDKFYSNLKKQKIKIIFSLILKLLTNPKIFLDIYKRFIVVKKRSESSDKEESESCELSSIAVSPYSNNKGYGRQLINLFVEESKKYNVKCIYLTTDADNNDNVNKFYKSCGFIVSETFTIFNNRKMNKYIKYIN